MARVFNKGEQVKLRRSMHGWSTSTRLWVYSRGTDGSYLVTPTLNGSRETAMPVSGSDLEVSARVC